VAVQHGPIKLTGQFGGISYYEMDGKYYARRKTDHSAERIRTDPAFKRTHQNSLEFGAASSASKLLRGAWKDIVHSFSDSYMAGRLTGSLVRVLKADTTHTHGKRTVSDGDFSHLLNFELNEHEAFSTWCPSKPTVTVNRTTGQVGISLSLQHPTAGEPILVTGIICINFRNGTHTAYRYERPLTDFTADTHTPTFFEAPLCKDTQSAVIITLGTSHHSTAPNNPQSLNNAMSIIGVDPPAKNLNRSPWNTPTPIRSRKVSATNRPSSPCSHFSTSPQSAAFQFGVRYSVFSVRYSRTWVFDICLVPTRRILPLITPLPMSIPRKPLVNYVLHLNNLRARIKSDRRLKSGHISLYYALFHTWNERRFQNPINVYRDEVMNESRVGSRNNYARYMRELGEWGYIQYTSDSKSSLGSIVQMIPFDTTAIVQPDDQKVTDEQKSVPASVPASVQVVTQTGLQIGTGSDTRGETKRPATPYYNINNINTLNVNGANTQQSNTSHDFYLEKSNAGYTQPPAEKRSPGVREGGGPRPQNLHEVISFFREIGAPTVDARKFYHYHESSNWTIGKNRTPLVDWKARARRWTLSDATNELPRHPGASHPPEDKNYSEPL
jgi:hypothetical protein